jgi:hypothetical protein
MYGIKYIRHKNCALGCLTTRGNPAEMEVLSALGKIDDNERRKNEMPGHISCPVVTSQ